MIAKYFLVTVAYRFIKFHIKLSKLWRLSIHTQLAKHMHVFSYIITLTIN